MKILFILDEFLPENSGGAANVAFGLAKGIMKSGHQILVLTATNDERKAGETEIEGVKIKIIFTKPFGRLRNWKNIKNRPVLREAEKIIGNYKPDAVHIHTLHHRFSYGVINSAKKYAGAVFITLHDAQAVYNGKLFPKRKICGCDSGDYKISWLDRLKKDGPAFNPFQRFFIKRALKKTDKIFAVSDALKNALETNGIPNIEVIHNGIDAKEWPFAGVGEKKIIFIGRVGEAKGIFNLIEAFETAKSKIAGAKLIIVGDGDFDSGRDKNIEIMPWQGREAVKKIFSEAGAIAVPSLYLDPFPTVNLEAMAAGKPVVGTCFGGTPEAIIDGVTGYIVNPYDKEKLAEKIVDLLENPEKAAILGKAGRERAENFFSLESQTEKTLEWYRKFLN